MKFLINAAAIELKAFDWIEGVDRGWDFQVIGSIETNSYFNGFVCPRQYVHLSNGFYTTFLATRAIIYCRPPNASLTAHKSPSKTDQSQNKSTQLPWVQSQHIKPIINIFEQQTKIDSISPLSLFVPPSLGPNFLCADPRCGLRSLPKTSVTFNTTQTIQNRMPIVMFLLLG